MAQYDITYQCGHTITEQLYGKHTERQRRIEAAQYRLCPDCYRAQQLAKATEANAELPALTGSEKQISWAEQIRAEIIGELIELENVVAASDATGPDVEAKKLQIAAAAATLRANTSATYWIDNRDRSARLLINAIIKEA